MKKRDPVSNHIEADFVDRDSYEPAYVQLAKLLKRKIGAGLFLPGEMLPSESELRSFYKVSQMTVRQAINILAGDGVVRSLQGKGTFVKPMNLGAFSFQLGELQKLFIDKKHASIKFLEVDLVIPAERIAKILSIPPGERAVYIRRLILKDNEPVLIHSEYLIYDPTRPLVESEMEVTSLEGLFDGSGQTDLKKGEISINAAVFNDDEAGLLKVPPQSPAFKMVHVFYDFNDKVVSWGQFLCRGDQSHFSTKVGIWE